MTRARRPLVATILTVMAFGGQHSLNAQGAGSVAGLVLDATTRDVVPLAVVTVVGLALSDTTDAQGRYLIKGVPSGEVRIQAQRIGFHLLISPTYALQSDSTLQVHFELTPQPVGLEAVEVRGEAPERRAAIGAKVLTRGDLPGRGNILEALQGVAAGIQTSGRRDDTRVSIRGNEADALYVIDGTVVTPPLTFYLDAQDVECVEIRRGARAAQEFRPSIAGERYGGVILIWTRGSSAPKPRECGVR